MCVHDYHTVVCGGSYTKMGGATWQTFLMLDFIIQRLGDNAFLLYEKYWDDYGEE